MTEDKSNRVIASDSLSRGKMHVVRPGISPAEAQRPEDAVGQSVSLAGSVVITSFEQQTGSRHPSTGVI